MNTVPDEQNQLHTEDMANADTVSGVVEDDQRGDELPVPRQSMRDRANAPSDTVGTGSYAAVTCSVLALMTTALLIAGLLLSRWLF